MMSYVIVICAKDHRAPCGFRWSRSKSEHTKARDYRVVQSLFYIFGNTTLNRLGFGMLTMNSYISLAVV